MRKGEMATIGKLGMAGLWLGGGTLGILGALAVRARGGEGRWRALRPGRDRGPAGARSALLPPRHPPRHAPDLRVSLGVRRQHPDRSRRALDEPPRRPGPGRW